MLLQITIVAGSNHRDGPLDLSQETRLVKAALLYADQVTLANPMVMIIASMAGVISEDLELKEKKHRIEDALSTTRAAVEEGLVAGGGTALLQAIPALDSLKLEGDAQVGVDIVRKALEAPARQIADNAGQSGEVVVNQVRNAKIGHGYDALRNEYGDMFKKGIVDARKVTRSALQNAASIAAMVLTTETLITDIPEKEKAGAGGGHGHPGEMDF